jgi:hypothetical protein
MLFSFIGLQAQEKSELELAKLYMSEHGMSFANMNDDLTKTLYRLINGDHKLSKKQQKCWEEHRDQWYAEMRNCLKQLDDYQIEEEKLKPFFDIYQKLVNAYQQNYVCDTTLLQFVAQNNLDYSRLLKLYVKDKKAALPALLCSKEIQDFLINSASINSGFVDTGLEYKRSLMKPEERAIEDIAATIKSGISKLLIRGTSPFRRHSLIRDTAIIMINNKMEKYLSKMTLLDSINLSFLKKQQEGFNKYMLLSSEDFKTRIKDISEALAYEPQKVSGVLRDTTGIMELICIEVPYKTINGEVVVDGVCKAKQRRLQLENATGSNFHDWTYDVTVTLVVQNGKATKLSVTGSQQWWKMNANVANKKTGLLSQAAAIRNAKPIISKNQQVTSLQDFGYQGDNGMALLYKLEFGNVYITSYQSKFKEENDWVKKYMYETSEVQRREILQNIEKSKNMPLQIDMTAVR